MTVSFDLDLLRAACILTGLSLFGLLVIWPIIRSDHFQQHIHYDWRKAIKGFRTMIVSWLIMVASAMVSAYDFLAPIAGGVDWHGLIDRVPPWLWPIILFAVAALFAWLRKLTTAPQPAAPLIKSNGA